MAHWALPFWKLWLVSKTARSIREVIPFVPPAWFFAAGVQATSTSIMVSGPSSASAARAPLSAWLTLATSCSCLLPQGGSSLASTSASMWPPVGRGRSLYRLPSRRRVACMDSFWTARLNEPPSAQLACQMAAPGRGLPMRRATSVRVSRSKSSSSSTSSSSLAVAQSSSFSSTKSARCSPGSARAPRAAAGSWDCTLQRGVSSEGTGAMAWARTGVVRRQTPSGSSWRSMGGTGWEGDGSYLDCGGCLGFRSIGPRPQL